MGTQEAAKTGEQKGLLYPAINVHGPSEASHQRGHWLETFWAKKDEEMSYSKALKFAPSLESSWTLE